MWRRNEEPKPAASLPDSPSPTPRSPARESVTSENLERTSPAAEPRSGGTRVSRAISIHGDITGREDLFIDGEVHGKIHLAGAVLTVGAHGRVTAEVEAKEIVVEGTMEGNLRATDRTEIRRSGSVAGDVQTARLVIEEGAVFRGRVEMGQAGESRAPAKAAAAAASSDAFRASAHPSDEQIQ